MTPHARLRQAVKWWGVAALTLIVLLRIISDLRPLQHVAAGWWLSFSHGWLELTLPGPNVVRQGDLLILTGPTVFVGTPQPHWYRWVADWRRDSIGAHARASLTLPFWIIAYITGFAWYVDASIRRRFRRNCCPQCGYDRTGLSSPDTKCPECGSAPDNPVPRP